VVCLNEAGRGRKSIPPIPAERPNAATDVAALDPSCARDTFGTSQIRDVPLLPEPEAAL
jgi:hypothetical protein